MIDWKAIQKGSVVDHKEPGNEISQNCNLVLST